MFLVENVNNMVVSLHEDAIGGLASWAKRFLILMMTKTLKNNLEIRLKR